MFAVFLDTTVLFVAFPDITRSFPTVSTASLSWVLNAYTILFAALLIPAGRLADRVGRRRMFLGAVIVFTVASAICGIAPNPELLILARALQAAGAACMIPASLALVLRAFPRERVPAAVALWAAVGALAGAIGPSLGSALVRASGWRLVFFINVPVGVVSVVLGRRILSESKEANPGPVPDPLGVVVLVAGVGLLALAVVQGNDWSWSSPPTLGSIAGGLALVGAFVVRCARVPHPVLDLDLFRSRNFRFANLGTAGFMIGFNASFFGNVLFLTQVWHYSIMRAGLAVTPGPLVVAVVAPFAGRYAGRVGQRRLLLPGGLIYASGALWLISRAGLSSHYLSTWLPGSLLTGLGVALVLPQLSSTAVQSLPPDRFASGAAVNQSIRQIGGTMGVALVVAVLGSGGADVLGRFHWIWAIVALSGVVASLSSLAIVPRARQLAAPAVDLALVAGH